MCGILKPNFTYNFYLSLSLNVIIFQKSRVNRNLYHDLLNNEAELSGSASDDEVEDSADDFYEEDFVNDNEFLTQQVNEKGILILFYLLYSRLC